MIGTTIASVISIPLLFYCYKKLKQAHEDRKAQNRYKRQQKYFESAKEQSEEVKWEQVNCRIKYLQEQLSYFEECWKSNIPRDNKRKQFFNEYMSLLNGHITSQQENDLLDMRPRIMHLYKGLLDSNHVSKSEIKKYKDYLEQLENI